MNIRAKTQPTQAVENTKVSLAEYFDLEYKAENRNEYVNGQIQAMAYTTVEHGQIVHNLDRLLGNGLFDKECTVIPNDRMLYTENCGQVFYPDLMIVCGTPQYKIHKKTMKATMNPTVLIEVLSDTTYDYDRIDKWACCKQIPSLQQYILVSQKSKGIEIRSKKQDGTWHFEIIDKETEKIQIGECEILFKDIYHKVKI
jgi:Uma2 family endonuclease